MKKVLKSNIKIILGFILGLIWSSGIVYAAVNGYLFDSDEVSYDNTSSGLTSENVQDALDELYANSDAYLAGLNAAHPVGSYLETSNSSFDPNVSIGGTWTSTSIKDDFIVEEEKSGVWTYRKWNSGLAEAWATYWKGKEGFSKWGNIYSSDSGETNYPTGLFSEVPVTLAQKITEGSNTVSSIAQDYSLSTEHTPKVLSIRGTSADAGITRAYYHAVGYWKTYTAPSTIYRWHRTA